jgi:hypothetical protein
MWVLKELNLIKYHDGCPAGKGVCSLVLHQLIIQDMRTKEFNELPLREKVVVFENSKKAILKPIADSGKYTVDLYFVANMTVMVLAFKQNRHIIQAIALGNAVEMLLDCVYVN